MQDFCCRTCHGCASHCAARTPPRVAPNVRLLGASGLPLDQHSMGTASAATTLVIWLQNTNNTYVLQNSSRPPVARCPLWPVRHLELSPWPHFNLSQGSYSVEWWNTTNGSIISRDVLSCADTPCSTTLSVPEFVSDIAAYLTPG